jgi:3-hydroxyisobutyrate dehydrogenase-like beta-hydroxyacid dehydrogenase
VSLDAIAPDRATHVGFVGLGSMGAAIAKRLVGRVTLHVFDLRPEAVEPLVDLGATPAMLGDLGRTCTVVFTCLPRSEDVKEVLFGEGGLTATLRPGSFVVDMTTGSPSVDHEIATRLEPLAVHFLDAPVAGGVRGAVAGTLCITVGGTAGEFAQVESLLRVISDRVMHVGGLGCGHVMKLVNNFLVNANRLAACEGIAIAVERGISLQTCLSALAMGTGHSQVTEGVFRRFAEQGVVSATGFTLGLAAKDTELARELFVGSSVPSEVVEQTAEIIATAAHDLGGERDATAAILTRYGSFGLPSEG